MANRICQSHAWYFSTPLLASPYMPSCPFILLFHLQIMVFPHCIIRNFRTYHNFLRKTLSLLLFCQMNGIIFQISFNDSPHFVSKVKSYLLICIFWEGGIDNFCCRWKKDLRSGLSWSEMGAGFISALHNVFLHQCQWRQCITKSPFGKMDKSPNTGYQLG